MKWTHRLLGLPYVDRGRSLAGVDCWGLVWLAYDAHGVSLPSYAEDYVDHRERAEVAALLVEGRSCWSLVGGDVQPLDVAVFRRAGIDAHVGVVVASGLMLHVDTTAPSRIEPYTGPKWGPRLAGIYRHSALI